MSSFYALIGRLANWAIKPAETMVIKYFPRSYVFIRAGEDILLVQNWLGDGQWSLPGGGRKSKETPLDAALREVHEETGIRLKPNQLVRLGDGQQARLSGEKRYALFKAELPVKIGFTCNKRELTDARWVNQAELRDFNCKPEVFEALSWASNLL